MIDRYFIRSTENRQRSVAPAEPKAKKIKRANEDEDNDSESNSSRVEAEDPSLVYDLTFLRQENRKVVWRKVRAENLDVDYAQMFTKREADTLFQEAEKVIHYDQTSQVFIHGRWVDIPRKQAAFGQDGLKYSFSGATVSAMHWTSAPFIKDICDLIIRITGKQFNFVLVNRYKDGTDHMGEHRDDEAILVPGAPIASLSLGQVRDFVFRHRDARGSAAKRKMEPIKFSLAHGSLLMMNHPTNQYWYHSLPVRRRALGVRINLTFRQILTSQ